MTPVRPAPWIVSQGPAFSVAEIDHALKAARRACDVLASNQLSDRGARPAMGMAYRELCDLAEVITYPEDGISAARILGSRGTAGELVLQLAQTRAKRGELALIADHWIDAPQRSRRGIVLAGRVEQVRHNGTTDLYVLQIALAGRRSVNVLSRLVPRMTRGDQAVVLGSLVDHPTAGLAALRNGDRVTVQAGVIRRVPDSPDGST